MRPDLLRSPRHAHSQQIRRRAEVWSGGQRPCACTRLTLAHMRARRDRDPDRSPGRATGAPGREGSG
jgi:hypothetical protein